MRPLESPGMRLGLNEGWAGRDRKTAVCPKCSSVRARYSRRRYDGPWILVFRVRPVKCSDCSAYFAISADATIMLSETDPVDLHIPFRPSELDDSMEVFLNRAPDQPPSASPLSRLARKVCPICRAEAVRPSNPGGDQALFRRLDVRINYRCAQCNGSFSRIDPLRFLAVAVILFGLLGGLSYFALATLGRSVRGNESPRIRRDQVRPPPPPVFR